MFESFYPNPNPEIAGLESRKDIFTNSYIDEGDEDYVKVMTELKTRDKFRTGITTLIGAMLRKQHCLELAACSFGEHLQSFAAKDVLLMYVLMECWRIC